MIGNDLVFTESFVKSVQRACLEFDPTGFDDGIIRRWANCDAVMQLRPIIEVGTGNHITKRRDMLMRRVKHGKVLQYSPTVQKD